MTALTCFTAYDVRGRLGVDLDGAIAYRIGRAFAQVLQAKTVVLGYDIRPTSRGLADQIAQALMDAGCTVLHLGLSGTEEMYFATSHFAAGGGICVTASHNPIEYNGMKMVQAGSAPLGEAEFEQIKTLAQADVFAPPLLTGHLQDVGAAARQAYAQCVTSFVDVASLRPLKILVNAGHGTGGPTFDAIARRLTDLGAPLVFERIFHLPDGTFPKGIPNPMLPGNRPATSDAVRTSGADFGVAWDGDFDRCFFFDHQGDFVDGEYVTGLLAGAILTKDPGATIIHDPRVIWNTQDVVASAGGRAVQARTGHAFIKQAMRDTDAAYGGEMSAHHYFKDFFYCDSGMIPWLMLAEQISKRGPLAGLVADRKAAFPSSGEINFTLTDPAAGLARVLAVMGPQAHKIDHMDGLSCDMGQWRFNLRCSNTEALVRLNVEVRNDIHLLDDCIQQVETVLQGRRTPH